MTSGHLVVEGVSTPMVARSLAWRMAVLGSVVGVLAVFVACGPDRGGRDDDNDGETNNGTNNATNNGGSNNGDVTPQAACSLEAPAGECPRGYTCLDGSCVSLGLVCTEGFPQGECAFGERCVDGVCWEEAQLCGAENDIGVCPTGEFCNQGFCTTREPCGPGQPSGSCPSGEVCFMGACRARGEICGPDNRDDGECAPGLACLQGVCHPEGSLCGPEQRGGRCAPGLTCSGGECLTIGEACTLGNPDGACAGGYGCFEGFCRDEAELCSASNPAGFCANRLSCIDGECRPQTRDCSYTVFDGLCPDGLVCSAGHCQGPVGCDDVFYFGSCPDGQTCLCDAHENGVAACRSCGRCSDAWEASGASTDQRRAIERTNELRNAIGMWSINQDPKINDATQAHAEYIVNEANEAHDQFQTDSPWFTGAHFWERMSAAGYTGQPFSEVIAYTGDPVGAVDGLIATVYHREPFFDPYALEMGYGGAIGPNGAADVINFGLASNACVEPILVVFPPHGAKDVPRSWDGLESPTPPAPPGGYPSGPILSVHGSDALVIETHRILIGDSEVEHTHLTSDNDPNGAIGSNHYFLYPHKPLRSNTEYLVDVTGRHGGQPFHLRWTFETE